MSAPAKNKNALKGAELKDSYIHMRVTAKQKASWVHQAQKQGMKLSEWIASKLD
jgi:hypothetical protein